MIEQGKVYDLQAFRRTRAVRDLRDRWMTKAQLAEHLGYSPRWVQYRVAEGMPHKRHYGRLAFQVGPVEDWLRENRPS